MFKKTRSGLKKAVSYSYIKESFSFVFSLSRNLTKIPKERGDKGHIAIDSLSMSKEQIDKAKRVFSFLVWVYLSFFAVISMYTAVSLISMSFSTTVLGIGSSLACLSLAFKYHFWLTQIRLGYIGITFKDWRENLLKRK